MSNAIVVRVHNPFNPALHRQVELVAAGFTINQWIERSGIVFSYPVLCTVNGEAILRARWGELIIDGDDVLVFCRLPEGDGGGGKNPLLTIIGFALIASGVGIAGLSTFTKYALIGSGVALIAVGLVSTPEVPSVDNIAKASPTYSLTAQGNLARIGEAIPVIYGYHRVFPDFATAPYSDYVDNNQFLYHLLVIGQGEYDLHDIFIEDTPIDRFKEITWQKVEPDGAVTLFNPNVITSLEVSGSEVSRNIGDATTFIEMEFNTGLKLGNTAAVTVNNADTLIDRVAVDIKFPGGLYYASTTDNGETRYDQYIAVFLIQTRLIDDAGNAIGEWVDHGREVIRAATTKAFTKTYLYALDSQARYEVRIGRDVTTTNTNTNTAAAATRVASGAIWTAVRGYLIDLSDSFVLNPVKTKATRVSIDVTFPRGLYSAAGATLYDHSVKIESQVRQIDDDGNAIGEWLQLGTQTITDKVRSAVRKTFTYDLAIAGRYEIVLIRETPNSTLNTVADDMHWVGARAYLNDTIDYSGLTLLAVKMRATDNLSGQASRKINTLVTRKIPTWSPDTGWSGNTPTKSISWALTDILRNETYGAGWDDSRIDLVGLYALDRVLSDRGDFLNCVFDRKMSMREVLRLACRVGRATAILPGGVFRAIRDRQQSIPVAMFSTRNIVKGSFSIKYAMAVEDSADGITLEYIDSATWKPDEVTVGIGDALPVNPAKVKLFGCTSVDQATREAKYLLNTNLYRRRTIYLTTEMEGYLPTYGDLVAVSHDMPQWGVSGDVTGLDYVGGEDVICVSEPIAYDAGKTYYIAFRTKAGAVSGPWQCEHRADQLPMCIKLVGNWTRANDPGGNFTILTNTDTSETVRLYYGGGEERTHFMYGIADKWSQFGVVKSIRPRGENRVELQILTEDDRVHET